MDQEKNRRWIWSAAIVVVLLALAAWFGRPAYKHFKERRSQVQAQTFLAKGDYRSAVLSARQVLMLNPSNVPACRIMAASADLSHSPAVLDWQWRMVQAEPTIENKLLLASSSLRYQSFPFPLARQILDDLPPTATNLANYQVVAASLALSLRRLDEAENHFETATKLEPTNQLYELNLAILRLGSTNATKVIPSRAVLENLRTDANLGPPALRALVVDRILHRDVAGAENYSTQLLAGAQATVADRLQHLGILRQLQRADFAVRLQAVQQSAVTNALAVAEVAAWMQANDLLAEDLRWLTNLPAGLQSQPPVRLSLANGYLQSADWPKLRDFTSKGNWEEAEFLRLALLARAWSQLDMPPMADHNWSAAINSAGGRFGALTTLLGLTEQWKLPREREVLLQRLVEKFPRERWAQRALEELYLAAGNTASLRQLYSKLFAVFPQDAGLKNNLAATCLLLATNVSQACQWAEEVYAGRTNDLIVASTYAFALHLQGRTPDGLAVLRKLDDRQLHRPDAALYYAVLLAATGATNEAASFGEIARTKTQWLPEEKRLLSRATGEF